MTYSVAMCANINTNESRLVKFQKKSKATSMVQGVIPSLLTIPIENVYRIFDHLDPLTIITSLCNTCLHLNRIIDTYEPYKVNYGF